jgi:hypothetical protein
METPEKKKDRAEAVYKGWKTTIDARGRRAIKT